MNAALRMSAEAHRKLILGANSLKRATTQRSASLASDARRDETRHGEPEGESGDARPGTPFERRARDHLRIDVSIHGLVAFRIFRQRNTVNMKKRSYATSYLQVHSAAASQHKKLSRPSVAHLPSLSSTLLACMLSGLGAAIASKRAVHAVHVAKIS